MKYRTLISKKEWEQAFSYADRLLVEQGRRERRQIERERENKLRLSYRQACAEIKECIESYLTSRDLGHIGVNVYRYTEGNNMIKIDIDMIGDHEFFIIFDVYCESACYAPDADPLEYRRHVVRNFLLENAIVRRLRHAIKKQAEVACAEYDEILALQDLLP